MDLDMNRALDKLETKVDSIETKVDSLVLSNIRLETIIVGATGDNGLIGQVKCLKRDQAAMRRNFWVLVTALAGSGVFTASFLTFLR